MKDISQVLNANRFQVSELLRRYRVVGQPDMASIERAYNQHGETFMLKLLDILVPDNAQFTELITPRAAVLTTAPLDTKKLMPIPEVESKSKTWSFWDNLLNAIGRTGETVGKFKKDVTGAIVAEELSPEMVVRQDNNRKMLYWAAAAFVILIITLLLLKK